MKTFITEYLTKVKEIADQLRIEDFARVVTILYESWGNDKNIFICGNGGSASTASHLASDLSKLGMKAYCLNDNPARMTAITNDSGWGKVYSEQLGTKIDKGDTLICISVHGGLPKWSNNLWQAMDIAKSKGAKVIGIVGCDGGVLYKEADASIRVENNETPLIEGWHGLITHLIVELMKENQPTKVCSECQRIRSCNTPRCDCGAFESEMVLGVVGNISEVTRLCPEFIDNWEKDEIDSCKISS